MITLFSLMWVFALFFAFLGFLRGWNQELVATAGILLGLFAILQFDGLLRGTLFFTLPRDQIFLIEAGVFGAIVFIVYQAREVRGARRRTQDNWQSAILGVMMGFFNGYLVGGGLWYLLDINEYPLSQFITAPALNSPSATSLNLMPLMLIGGGASGTGDLLAVVVIFFLFLVVVVI